MLIISKLFWFKTLLNKNSLYSAKPERHGRFLLLSHRGIPLLRVHKRGRFRPFFPVVRGGQGGLRGLLRDGAGVVEDEWGEEQHPLPPLRRSQD